MFLIPPQPFVSVVVPVYNAGRYFEQCLCAIESSSYPHYEIIVVDDGSTDDSAAIAHRHGAKVLETPSPQSGPAAARNLGVQEAQGEIILFLDSDVLAKPDTIQRVVDDFLKEPHIDALFGSYDDEPLERDFYSQYKNLYHHFVHQHASREASTFWAGCGAVRRDAFLEVGGFDAEQYPKPTIEDIELGYRLRRAGHRIRLDPKIEVKHLKRWGLRGMLRADIFYRAVPWSRLIFENQAMVNDLNLKTSERLSAGLTCLSLGLLPLAILQPWLLLAIAAFLSIVIGLNRRLYGFFLRKRGLRFALFAFPLHLLYYVYSTVTYVVCWAQHRLSRGGRRHAPANP